MDVAENRFRWLVTQRGFRYWDETQLEEKLVKVTTRPDFYVETPFGDILAEVECFTEPGPIDRRGGMCGAVDPDELLDRPRGLIKHAARQLRPYSDLNLPCLVVLDNWRGFAINLGYPWLTQVFGTFEFRGRYVPESGTLGPLKLRHGGGRRLKEGQHTYVSAVAVNINTVNYLDDDVCQERRMRVRIIHNPFADCPFPMDILGRRRRALRLHGRRLGCSMTDESGKRKEPSSDHCRAGPKQGKRVGIEKHDHPPPNCVWEARFV